MAKKAKAKKPAKISKHAKKIQRDFYCKPEDSQIRVNEYHSFGWKLKEATQRGNRVKLTMTLDVPFSGNKELKELFNSYRRLKKSFPWFYIIVAVIGLGLLLTGCFIQRDIGMWLIIPGVVVLCFALFMILSFVFMIKVKDETINEIIVDAKAITNVSNVVGEVQVTQEDSQH